MLFGNNSDDIDDVMPIFFFLSIRKGRVVQSVSDPVILGLIQSLYLHDYNLYRQYDASEHENDVLGKYMSSRMKSVPTVLFLKIGAEVILTYNALTSLGLYNGARGRVVGFLKRNSVSVVSDVSQIVPAVVEGNLEPPIVLVQFYDYDGPSYLEHIDRVVPIVATRSLRRLSTVKGYSCEVMQIPLKPAWAMTTHKSQGLTISRVTCSVKGSFESGQNYVALSRTKSRFALQIIEPILSIKDVVKRPRVIELILADYDRLVTQSLVTIRNINKLLLLLLSLSLSS
jgi:hypothetical protein